MQSVVPRHSTRSLLFGRCVLYLAPSLCVWMMAQVCAYGCRLRDVETLLKNGVSCRPPFSFGRSVGVRLPNKFSEFCSQLASGPCASVLPRASRRSPFFNYPPSRPSLCLQCKLMQAMVTINSGELNSHRTKRIAGQGRPNQRRQLRFLQRERRTKVRLVLGVCA